MTVSPSYSLSKNKPMEQSKHISSHCPVSRWRSGSCGRSTPRPQASYCSTALFLDPPPTSIAKSAKNLLRLQQQLNSYALSFGTVRVCLRQENNTQSKTFTTLNVDFEDQICSVDAQICSVGDKDVCFSDHQVLTWKRSQVPGDNHCWLIQRLDNSGIRVCPERGMWESRKKENRYLDICELLIFIFPCLCVPLCLYFSLSVSLCVSISLSLLWVLLLLLFMSLALSLPSEGALHNYVQSKKFYICGEGFGQCRQVSFNYQLCDPKTHFHSFTLHSPNIH